MKFNCIISNPPYNKDIYLDFVSTAYDILESDGVSIFITPAGWQMSNAEGGNTGNNQYFRDNIVPAMKDILYWSRTKDVFEIAREDGISVYTVYKNIEEHSDNKHIRIYKQKTIIEDSIRPLNYGFIYMTNEEAALVKRLQEQFTPILSSSNTWQFKPATAYFTSARAEEVIPYKLKNDGITIETDKNGNKIPGRKSEKLFDANSPILIYTAKYKTRIKENAITHRNKKLIYPERLEQAKQLYKLVGSSRLCFQDRFNYYLFKPCDIPGGQDTLIFMGLTEDECRSAASYFGSKLIWYLMRRFYPINATETIYTFVPALPQQYKFDHIFTSEEVYTIFGITYAEQKIIDSLITYQEPQEIEFTSKGVYVG